jgi:2-alkyl-3-oxoalkanoate reductase
VSKPHCGLSEPLRKALDTKIDLVIHCAATTSFNESDAFYDQTNISGTAHILALALQKPFLHISTAYVCGTKTGLIKEEPCAADGSFANGYESSKAMSEALVMQSCRPWLIARPSIVSGAESDGQIRRFDAIYAAFKMLAEGRIKGLPAHPDATLNFVPVDFVCNALAQLAGQHAEFAGQFVHLWAR